MYKLSIPLTNHTTTDENINIYIEMCKKAKVDRIFLCPRLGDDTKLLANNIRIFKETGFEVGVWVANTIGHGGTVVGVNDSGEKPKYQRIVDLDGNECFETFCPLDASRREFVSSEIARFAALGPDLVMLDDDYRISQHGAQPCCVCDLHMEKIREYCGENISREELKALAFSGKPNKYRDAYLRAQGESLELLASDIRKAVDKVAPDCPVAVCSAYSSWDLDGTDPLKITDILAGKNKKYLRLHGAPYWAGMNGRPLELVCEIARMFASFAKDKEIEIFSEGDPLRPRFHCPSSYLELFDAAQRADGAHDGILKYMFEYSSTPLYETGYVDRHVRNLPLFEKIAEFFKKGANAGVRVLIKPHLFGDADMNITPLRQQSPHPAAGMLLQKNAIPTLYSGEGICSALFGENARHFDPSEYKSGAILDGSAAAILTEQGTDVGLASFEGWNDCDLANICDEVTGFSVYAYKAKERLMRASFKYGIVPVLTDGENILAYKYENAEGKRFLVFTLCADAMAKDPAHMCSYEVQSALQREIEWIAKKPLPVKTVHAPRLYTLCEKGENYTSVILLNYFEDSVLDPVIELDREYKYVDFCNCTGRIEGKRIVLDQCIGVCDFVAFKAYN